MFAEPIEEVEVEIFTDVESQVVLHCYYDAPEVTAIRIWPSTFLVQENGVKRKLLHAYNISLHPHWELIPPGKNWFTLVFEGLDKSCRIFDMHEEIPELGGFFVRGINRNNSDVYRVSIEE